jgi:superfamily II helicase
MKAPPVRHVNTCSYCKHGTHIIDTTIHPNDIITKKDSSGKWICGDCQEEQIKNMIKVSKKRRGIPS